MTTVTRVVNRTGAGTEYSVWFSDKSESSVGLGEDFNFAEYGGPGESV